MNPDATHSIHLFYCKLTGLPLPYVEMYHARVWHEWLKSYDMKDLELVVRYLRRAYKDKPNVLAAMLRFRHLIINVDYFAEYLAEAKRLEALKRSDRQGVLAATGRPIANEQPARPAREHVAGALARLKGAVE